MKYIIKIKILFLFLILSNQLFSQSRQVYDQLCNDVLLCFENKDYKESLVWSDSIINNYPKSYAGYALKGEGLYYLEKYEEAILLFSKALNIKEKSHYNLSMRAACYSMIEEYEKAYNDLIKALNIENKNNTYRIRLSMYALNLKKYDQVIGITSKLIDENFENYNSFVLRGNAYEYLRKFEKAEIDYTKAIELDTINPHAIESKGQLLMKLEKYNEALILLEKLLKIPNLKKYKFTEAYTYNNIGYIYYKLDDLKSAQKYVEKSISLINSNSYAYRNLGLIYMRKKEMDLACMNLKKAIELNYIPLDHEENVMNILELNCK